MAFIRPEEKEINFKVVFWGPAASGKTTCLSYIQSKLAAPKKNKVAPVASPERTLFFDFLPLKLDKVRGLHARFHLYTVPGQVPYTESRAFLLKGVDGIAVVLDSQLERGSDNTHAVEEMDRLLADMGHTPDEIPVVFLYNKQDLHDRLTLDEMNALYNPRGLSAFAAIASKGEQVMDALSALIQKMVEREKRQPL